jgi:hypothetical protein
MLICLVNLVNTCRSAFALFNISGIQEMHGTIGSNRNQIDLNHLTAGIYFLNVFNDEGNQTKKVIKW